MKIATQVFQKIANLTWPGDKMRNDQKASKMAAKDKMAAEKINS